MIPPLDFLPLGPRQCQLCQRPLLPQARSDQKYCSERCRGLARRHGTTSLDWPARAEAAEQRVQALQTQLDERARAQQAAEPYEQRYEDLSRLLAVLARELPTAGPLASYIDFVDQLLSFYAQHPGLATGDLIAQRRLHKLQQLRSELLGVYQAFLNMQAQELQQKERAQATAGS